MKISTIRTIIILSCIFITFVLLQFVTGTHKIEIIKPLEQFPVTLGDWKKKKAHHAPEEVSEMLQVDDYIDYSYLNPEGHVIRFYVAFYETVGTGGGYHSPKNCLPGGGWGIDSVKNIQLKLAGKPDRTVTVTEMLIRNGAEYQVVIYWYQNRGRIINSEYWEKIYLVTDALLKGRRDGSFVRLTMFAPEGNIKKAQKELTQFAGLAINELIEFLPGS